METIQQGILDIWIDEIVACLKNTETGELHETVVFRIESRSFLKKFQKSNGWHIDWNKIPSNIEVYALALKENNEIQGLIGIVADNDARAVYIHWACVAPHNNKWEFQKQKYAGVGGHLFAIAADKSIQYGFDGVIYGFAANQKLLKHYIEKFNADYLGIVHQYQFMIGEFSARQLLEVYHYEWNET